MTPISVSPVVLCDARQRNSVKKVLITLVRHAIAKSRAANPAAALNAAARGPGAPR